MSVDCCHGKHQPRGLKSRHCFHRHVQKSFYSLLKNAKMCTVASVLLEFIHISLNKKWGELTFLLEFNLLDRTKEGILPETFAFQQAHKKHQFSTLVHSLKHYCGLVILSVQFQNVAHVNASHSQFDKSFIHEWKSNTNTKSNILCQPAVRLPVILFRLTLRYFSFLTNNESFLISVIVVTFPQLSCWLFLSGGQVIQEGLTCQKPSKWLCCVWNGCVCVCVCRNHIWLCVCFNVSV